ncbi:uncharacterized protein LOC128048266 [Budorcas taxicolor]|uniref:uncharacterized protein LOC128048266 n=1 Tax=Budorcas taxicolor TaxID=37181 RepID=UPI002284F408|nr:uncharacterized protein LOC128048266 [Budorcas taxicolor]
MAASVGAAFLTTPAPRTSPARHSHSTSGAPPVRGRFIKGAEDRPLPSALRCAVGVIVLPEGRRGVKESEAHGRPLSLTRALHVLPEVAGEHKKSPSPGLTPQLSRVEEESRVLGMGSATTCRLSASNAATAPFPERVPVLLLVAFASQPIGETLRPVWGPMDKCYPVTTQRRGVRSGKKHDSEAMSPEAMGGPNDASPKAETAVLSMEERQVGYPVEEPVSLIPGAKGVTEKEEVAGTPGWQETKKARKETAVYVSEASEEHIVEERPRGWVPHLLRKLWLGRFPASDIPKTRSH